MKKTILFFMLFMAIGFPNITFATTVSKEDVRSVSHGSEFYSTEGGTCSGSVPTSVNLPKSTVDAINKLQSDYQAAEAEGVPWQFIAAVHYRENHNDPNTSPLAGEPLGSPNPDHPGLVIHTVKEGATYAAKLMKDNAQNVYGVKVGKSNSVDELKKIFVAYNRGGLYKQGGIDPDKSPYAMNQYDSSHNDMSWPYNPPYEPVNGKDSNLGAVTVFAALVGIDGGVCSGSGGGSIVDVARQELAKNVQESPDGCNCGGPINTYTDNHPEFWCADFLSWVYKQAGKPFTGGESGGWRLPAVAGVVAWMQANGVYYQNKPGAPTPRPGDIIDFNHSGDESGNDTHIGIVESVSGGEVTTIEGNTSNRVARRKYSNYRSDNTIKGWGHQK